MDCVFCKIIGGEIPSYKIFEDEMIMAFLDVNPANPGHTLIVPKEHTLDMSTINNDALIKIMDKARDVAEIIIDKLHANGYTLVQNNGIAQDVKHFHLHVIPKYNKKIKMNIEEVHNIMTK